MSSSRSRRRLRRIAIYGVVVLLGLAAVVAATGTWTVRRPFPSHAGELALAGLTAPVTVHRDEYGIPQIYAEDLGDLFRAQGFVHSQDRFWQMDLRRHTTSGRLAELFGADLVETDVFIRTLGWHRVAEAEWGLLSPSARQYLTWYAEGVNAWIEQTGGPASTGRKALHYRVLGLTRPGYRVEPWDPVDSLAWLKAMAWDLSGNLSEELNRAVLLTAGLTRSQVEDLYPAYPYDDHRPVVAGGAVVAGAFDPTAVPDGDRDPAGEPVPTSETAAAAAVSAAARNLARAPAALGGWSPGAGSNAWVVSGEHTGTGAPMLANDPHLGLTMPGVWYQLGLHCTCGYRVAGVSFAGLPGVVIGHNDRIAWGFTNLGADVTDLYLERVSGDRYQVDGQWRELTVEHELIQVAGGDDVTIQVRHTEHGPIVSDVDDRMSDVAARPPIGPDAEPLPTAEPAGEDYAVSLAWTALAPGRTVETLFALNQAAGWDAFRAAVAQFAVPGQNVLYADTSGTIGYQATGVVPVRGAGDGRWIAPGWDSAYDWQGWVAFEELPYDVDPERGWLVTANQAVTGPEYPHRLTDDWAYGYRGDRIEAVLAGAVAEGPVDAAGMRRLLADDRHGFAPVLVPALLAAGGDGPERAALDLLAQWDYRQPADGDGSSTAAAAYFNAVWRHLLELTFDELPDDAQPGGGDRWFEVVRHLLADPTSPWWDRVDTEPVERRDGILAVAAAAAYEELAAAQGDDPAEWSWGRMHTLLLRDDSLGRSGNPLAERLFNRGPVQSGGGADAVNATFWWAPAGYEVTHLPSMRMIIDLADLDASGWVQLAGNSGHPYHRNYTDQLEPWRTGELVPWPWSDASVEAAATDTLVLAP